jgi:hypothetical protein
MESSPLWLVLNNHGNARNIHYLPDIRNPAPQSVAQHAAPRRCMFTEYHIRSAINAWRQDASMCAVYFVKTILWRLLG